RRRDGTKICLELGGRDARRDAVADTELSSFDESVTRSAAHALETTVELREPLSLLRAFLGGRTQASPQRDRLFTARDAGPGAVTCRTRQRDAQRDTPLVRNRDRVPTERLADDAP